MEGSIISIRIRIHFLPQKLINSQDMDVEGGVPGACVMAEEQSRKLRERARQMEKELEELEARV